MRIIDLHQRIFDYALGCSGLRRRQATSRGAIRAAREFRAAANRGAPATTGIDGARATTHRVRAARAGATDGATRGRYGQIARAFSQAQMSLTAFGGAAAPLCGIAPPRPNHAMRFSSPAVPVTIHPCALSAAHIVAALSNVGV